MKQSVVTNAVKKDDFTSVIQPLPCALLTCCNISQCYFNNPITAHCLSIKQPPSLFEIIIKTHFSAVTQDQVSFPKEKLLQTVYLYR